MVEAFGGTKQNPTTSRGRVLKVRSVNTRRYDTEEYIEPHPRSFRKHSTGGIPRTKRRNNGWATEGKENDEPQYRRDGRQVRHGYAEPRPEDYDLKPTDKVNREPQAYFRPESAGSDNTTSTSSSSQSSNSESASQMSASSAASYASRKSNISSRSEQSQHQVAPSNVTGRHFQCDNPMMLKSDAAKKKLPPGLMRCKIVRHSRGLRQTQYYLHVQDTTDGDSLILAAQKQRKSGNMHIFDMTRGYIGRNFSKKHGNYVGKVEGKLGSNAHAIYSTKQDSSDACLVMFQKDGIINKINDGILPRRMGVVLPKSKSGDDTPKETIEMLHKSFLAMGHSGTSNRALSVFGNKSPVYERGNYRLNFHGRVTHASVKNFQLIERHGLPDDDEQDILLQFGKTGSDTFVLDFNPSTFSPFVAFGVALTHFSF